MLIPNVAIINARYNKNRIIPSPLSSFPLPKLPRKNQRIIVEVITNDISAVNTVMLMSNLEKTSTIPKINVRFVKQLPIVLPSANPIWFFLIAERNRENSGREVPNAIMVAPMTDSFIPIMSAMKEEESTTNLELIIIPAKPKIKINTDL